MSRPNLLESALSRVSSDLNGFCAGWALVGGLAVSARAEPRTTRDVDVAVHVTNDAEAEKLLFGLRGLGYEVEAIVEQRAAARLATARLRAPMGGVRRPLVDLLFSSCGIEPEIVSAATPIELFEALSVPVATVAHLIAMKVLARDDRRRPQDWDDLRALLGVAQAGEVEGARSALELIALRGYHRGRQLVRELDRFVAEESG